MRDHAPWYGLLACLSCLLGPQPATAQPTPMQPSEPVEKVLLLENFSPLELATLGAGVTGAGVLGMWGTDLFGRPVPSMGPPHPESVDWRFAHWSNPEPDPARQWLAGIPDYAGYAMPVGLFTFYIASAAAQGSLSTFPPAHHELVAYTEAFTWTLVTVNILKLVVGRERPFVARDDIDPSQVNQDESQHTLSFPSGHSAAAAATATFIFHDLSDYLVHGALADSHPAWRYGVGYGAPLLGALGTTSLVMHGRVRDQRHWLSDTLAGAFIGGSLATLFYVMHFDDEGAPRKRREARDSTKTSPNVSSAHMAPSAPNAPAGISFGMQF